MKKLKGLIISTVFLLCTATAGAFQVNATSSGDINGDGKFSVADVVLMQQYLLNSLNESGSQIFADTDAIKIADLDSDGKTDVFDFIIMRGKLIIAEKDMTVEEFIDLLCSKEEYTWSDFEQYKSVDIDNSETHTLKYEIYADDSKDNMFLYVSGADMNEKPEKIWLESSDGQTMDIYELRKEMLDFLDTFKVPENSEADRKNALAIGEYALDGLKNGTFDLDTTIWYEEIADNTTLAEAWNESRIHYVEFSDKHTAIVTVNGGGFFDVYGYLVTNGTVEYELGWNDNIGSNYDGGGVDVREKYGNIYFFYAST